MRNRFRNWERALVRGLAEPSGPGLWLEHHGVTPRRTVRTVFCLWLVCCIASDIWWTIESALALSDMVAPWIIVKQELTCSGVLFVPVTFFLLFRMRASRWTWFATGLVALLVVPWYFFDGLSVYLKAGMWTLLFDKETDWESLPLFLGRGAMLYLFLFGLCDRIALLVEQEWAAQRARGEL